MKIDLPLAVYWGELCPPFTRWGWHVVEGEIVDVAPHLQADFAVHKALRNGWIVSDMATGTAVHHSAATSRHAAIAQARAYLGTKTTRDMLRAWSRLKRLSPLLRPPANKED